MTATATQIFKIRAHSDYITSTPSHLSFRSGQPFYALSTDYSTGVYFVSTQFAVPFARTAVTGTVPMKYFERVDLMSIDPAISRKKRTVPTLPAVITKDINQGPIINARKQSLTGITLNETVVVRRDSGNEENEVLVNPPKHRSRGNSIKDTFLKMVGLGHSNSDSMVLG